MLVGGGSKNLDDLGYLDDFGISFAPAWYDVQCDMELQPLCEKSCEDCSLDHGKFDKATCIVLHVFS